MQHRIRPAALVLHQDRLLVVKEQEPEAGAVWWCPPGGGLEGDESVFDAARREVWEETGFVVRVERIVYIREYVDTARQTHNLELYLLAHIADDDRGGFQDRAAMDPDLARDHQFMTRDELQTITVYPQVLQTEFWDDARDGFPSVRYLGLALG